ncbi:exported hypothetical protein [uncultured Desulfobacterium sp.]|uniref:SAF domain-containing protein n=1 Tax=uncultured Desulfobacterium sp. TaxID=201089 RepID=A0A445MTA0_9BACT|nr:exported hypothetical protein [uncultured Desulfobacterium sp.]
MSKKSMILVRKILVCAICAIGSFVCSGLGMSYASIAQIEVYQRADIDQDDILLDKISEIKSDDRELINQLKNIIIGSCPLPGESRNVDRGTIIMKLKQNNIDIEKIDIIGPQQVMVFRQGNRISAKEIEKIILDFVYTRLPWDKSKIKVKGIQSCDEVILPTGVISYEISPPKNTDYLGTIPLSIQFLVNGRPERKIWVSVSIEVFAEVVVTKRPLGRHKMITEDDLEVVVMDLAKVPSNGIKNSEVAVGKRTKRQIDAYAVLQEDQIENAPLIKRGDIVIIVAESDVLKVTTLGRAKEKGGLGDVICIENVDSKKGIYAKVMDSKTVRVEF